MSQIHKRASGKPEPAITVRMGFSRNPLQWVMTSFQSFVGLGLAVLGVVVTTQFSQSGGPCCGSFLVLLALPLVYRSARAILLPNRSIVWFDDGGFEILERISGGQHNGYEEFAYTDIGHFELTSMAEIKILARSTKHGGLRTISIVTSAGAGEDLFDSLLDHIEKHAPDHLFSIYENGAVRYSREFELAEVYPNNVESVNRISLAELGRLPIVKATDEHILAHHGLVLASVVGAAYRELVVTLCNEQVYQLWGDGSLRRDNECIGKFEQRGYQPWRHELDLTEPLPGIIAEILLAAFEHGRQRMRL